MVGVNAVIAAPIADIRNTKHNFSATVIPDPSMVTRTAHATTESQICAFCHTPHGATPEQKAPLWNRQLSSATYTLYNSNPVAGTSLDATDLGNPSGKSKLCLSCHDGTIALGAVNVLNRQQNPQISMTGTSTINPGTIPEGLGRDTGFTRRLGVDLTNDHPISFTFDSAQAARDGELYNPAQ
ncbi:MAG: cytochrome c3 family protein, partial [Gammaproteobacteria bacterium]